MPQAWTELRLACYLRFRRCGEAHGAHGRAPAVCCRKSLQIKICSNAAASVIPRGAITSGNSLATGQSRWLYWKRQYWSWSRSDVWYPPQGPRSPPALLGIRRYPDLDRMERITVENAARFVFGETSRMVVGGETGLKYLRAGVFQKPPKRNKGRRRISLRTM